MPQLRGFSIATRGALLLASLGVHGAAAQSVFDGPYAGIRAGYEHADVDHRFDDAPGGTGSNTVSFGGNGAAGGGFLGYGRALGQFYLGAEAGLGGAATQGSRHFGADEKLNGDVGAAWEIGLRAGYLWNGNLIAATGGFGQRRVKYTFGISGVEFGSVKSWADAPFIGLGFERPLAEHVFWRFDYRHAWIATKEIGAPETGIDAFRTQTDQFLLGALYRF